MSVAPYTTLSHPIGIVQELACFPVKSMAGVVADSWDLGWHGLTGDRRLAFRRLADNSGFPWLSASRMPQLVCYQPFAFDQKNGGESLPTLVRTPEGRELELAGESLLDEIGREAGTAVELMHLKHGIFDDAPVSLIASATIASIGAHLGYELDRRRFRANVVLQTEDTSAFTEDHWVGATLVFGEGWEQAAVKITKRDIRCSMVNIDPDSGNRNSHILSAIVQMNANHAGVYGTVIRTGKIKVGDKVYMVP